MKTRLFLGVGLAGILGLAAAGCTNVEGENEAPVTITVNLEEQPGFINVGSGAPIQIPTIELASRLKNPTASDPQGFATTQVNSYEVRYRRTDGGTRVPPLKTFACGITVEAGGQATLNNFPILAGTDLQEAPFDQLFPFNGGIDRETGRAEIQMAFDITFFGRTVSGHRVQSQTASGLLLFVFAGSEPLSRN